MAREPQTEIDGGREIEPVRCLVAQREIELLDATRELRGLEVRAREILAKCLKRSPWIWRRPSRRRDVALDVIDDEAEPIAQPAQRFGQLTRDLDGNIACNFLLLHKLPVSKNHVSLTPSSVRPREYPNSNVPGTK